MDRVGRPMVGQNAVPGPYLFMGAVGVDGQTGRVACLRGFAQPIVGTENPIPVDSDYERRAFGALRVTAKIVEKAFPGARVEIEKPVFDIGTPEGRCLPDFLVTVRRDADEVRFVIEVMGFTRASYLEGKQETHPRMETLGTLCKMQATEFGEGKDGANAEGRKVTQRIRGILVQRWAQ